MQNLQELYREKLTTAEEAVKKVRSGDWVDYGWTTCHPVALDEALAARLPELTDIKIRGGIALWEPAVFKVPEAEKHMCWNSSTATPKGMKVISSCKFENLYLSASAPNSRSACILANWVIDIECTSIISALDS